MTRQIVNEFLSGKKLSHDKLQVLKDLYFKNPYIQAKLNLYINKKLDGKESNTNCSSN